MNRSARRLCAVSAITSLMALPFATTANATSPPEPDTGDAAFVRTEQSRVDEAIAAFGAVMRDAGLSPEDEEESDVDSRVVRLDALLPDSDTNLAAGCVDPEILDDYPDASDIDIRAYAVAWSVDFSGPDDNTIEWSAFGLSGASGDPIYDLRARLNVPTSDECVEDAMAAATMDSVVGTDVENFVVDFTSREGLGIGEVSAMVSLSFSAALDGEENSAAGLRAVASTTEGYVAVNAWVEPFTEAPDEDLALEALEAMVEALEA